MHSRALRDLQSRCSAALAKTPAGTVVVEAPLMRELLNVFEAAALVGRDATDEAVEKLLEVAVGLRAR